MVAGDYLILPRARITRHVPYGRISFKINSISFLFCFLNFVLCFENQTLLLMIHGLILQIGLKNMVVDKDFLMMKMVVEETNLIVIQIIVNLLWLF